MNQGLPHSTDDSNMFFHISPWRSSNLLFLWVCEQSTLSLVSQKMSQKQHENSSSPLLAVLSRYRRLRTDAASVDSPDVEEAKAKRYAKTRHSTKI